MSAVDQPDIADLTLGAILSDALRNAGLVAPERTPEDLALEADYRSAKLLSSMVAQAIGASASEAFATMDTWTPRNLQCLLSSPEGWTALAEFTANRLGKSGADISISVH